MCVVVLSAAVLPLHRVRNDDVLDSLPVIALPPDSPRCFPCGTACEAVSHAWRDRLPRRPGGSKQGCVIERTSRREYPRSGEGVF